MSCQCYINVVWMFMQCALGMQFKSDSTKVTTISKKPKKTKKEKTKLSTRQGIHHSCPMTANKTKDEQSSFCLWIAIWYPRMTRSTDSIPCILDDSTLWWLHILRKRAYILPKIKTLTTGVILLKILGFLGFNNLFPPVFFNFFNWVIVFFFFRIILSLYY